MRNEREEALIRETCAVWEERYPNCLSEDEAKQILANVRDFFTLLHEWDQESNVVNSDEYAAEERTGGEHAA